MATIWKKWSIVLSICIALGIGTTTGMKIQTLTHNFGHESFLQDTSFLTSPGQVYGRCNQNSVHVVNNKFQADCTFAMESNEATDSPNHLRSCNFSMTTDVANSKEMFLIDDIIAITADKAILKILGIESNMFYILNFADCTASNALTNTYPISIYAPSDNMFDVIYTKPGQSEDKYRTIVDTKGSVQNENQLWLKMHSDIITIAQSPGKGRIVVDEYVNHSKSDSGEPVVRIHGISETDAIKLQKEYPVEKKNPRTFYKRTVTSTTYNLLTVCTKLDMTLTCAQFDLDGSQKFETKFSLDEYSHLYSLNLHNLPGGGFLLFITKCKETEKDHCRISESSFDVIKFDATGKSVGKLSIDNKSNTAYSKTSHVFKNKENEICLSAVQEQKYSDKLTLNIACLKDNDFSGKITWPNN